MICPDCARAAAIIDVFAWQPGQEEMLLIAATLHEGCHTRHKTMHHGVFYAPGCNCQHEFRRHVERVRAARSRAA